MELTIISHDYSYGNFYEIQDFADIQDDLFFLRFQVRGASDVHVLLSSYPNIEGELYEIIIGGKNDQRSCIREKVQGKIKAEVFHEKLLSKTEFRGFWLGFTSDGVHLSVGKKTDTKPFISYQRFKPFNIKYIAVTAWDQPLVYKLNHVSNPRDHKVRYSEDIQFEPFNTVGNTDRFHYPEDCNKGECGKCPECVRDKSYLTSQDEEEVPRRAAKEADQAAAARRAAIADAARRASREEAAREEAARQADIDAARRASREEAAREEAARQAAAIEAEQAAKEAAHQATIEAAHRAVREHEEVLPITRESKSTSCCDPSIGYCIAHHKDMVKPERKPLFDGTDRPKPTTDSDDKKLVCGCDSKRISVDRTSEGPKNQEAQVLHDKPTTKPTPTKPEKPEKHEKEKKPFRKCTGAFGSNREKKMEDKLKNQADAAKKKPAATATAQPSSQTTPMYVSQSMSSPEPKYTSVQRVPSNVGNKYELKSPCSCLFAIAAKQQADTHCACPPEPYTGCYHA